MELNEYQERAGKLACYPEIGLNVVYPTLGLVGEAGEVAEKVKKVIRDSGGCFTDPRVNYSIGRELGDVLWYVQQLAMELGYTLQDIADLNIEKLEGRQERGTLQGSGDDR